jgi:hypothetical protein
MKSSTPSRVGGIAALLVMASLIAGLLGLAIPLQGLGLRNWLVVLFQINAGAGELPVDPLHVFNPFDVAILVLVGVAFASLGRVLGRGSAILKIFAAGLPFAGIVILLTTGQAGRSSVMGAGLVMALLIFMSGRLARTPVYLGLVANALLLVGDFATGTSAKPLIAAVVAIGYVMLVFWFALIAVKLLRLSTEPATSDAYEMLQEVRHARSGQYRH